MSDIIYVFMSKCSRHEVCKRFIRIVIRLYLLWILGLWA